MAACVILFIVLGAFSALSHGTDVIPDDHITALLGGKVMFNTKLTHEQLFGSVAWRFHFNDSSSVSIITLVTNVITNITNNNTEPEYEGRISLNRTTGSLELRDLSLGDSGEYKVHLLPVNGEQRIGSCRLTVYEPISNVVVTSSSTELLEFSSSVNLSCSASGSFLSFRWLNDTSEVTDGDRVKLSDGNSTLTIVNVTRYDQRSFRCQVSNIGSNGTSEPIILSINFGPENINLMISPSREYYYEGADVTLSCLAASSPPAQYHWFLNESILVETGPELRLLNIKLSQSGNYSCQAINNKTLRNQTSEPSAVTVVQAHVSNVVINTNSTELVEFNSSVSLSCSSSGSSPYYLWLNDTAKVTVSDRVQLSDGNSTLIIVNVTRYDQGPFRCQVSNSFNNVTSDPVMLSISFGPENITFLLSPSQQYYMEGSNISLTCSAVSRPPALFEWFFNDAKLSDTGPELRLMNIQSKNSGNYSCQAFNNKTLRNQTSQPSAVNVLIPVSRVVITSNATQMFEFSGSVSLSCSASGSLTSVQWLNDTAEVTTSDRIQITDGGSTLTIVNVTRYDQGPFRCNVSNVVSSETSQLVNLVIYHGPDHVRIIGPNSAQVKDFTLLYCSTVSVPSPKFTWLFNGSPLKVEGAVHVIPSCSSSDSGKYTCTARNPVTGLSDTVHHELSVVDRCDCTTAVGLAVIITACCCVAISVLSALTVCCVMWRRKLNSSYTLQKSDSQLIKHLGSQEVFRAKELSPPNKTQF